MSEERDPSSRYRPPHETPFIQKMRNLLDASETLGSADLMVHLARVRSHLASATDEDLSNLVRLSVQMTPKKYTGTFQDILTEFKRRRQSCRSEQ